MDMDKTGKKDKKADLINLKTGNFQVLQNKHEIYEAKEKIFSFYKLAVRKLIGKLLFQ